MPKDKPSKSEPTGHTGYLRDGQIDDVAFWDEFFGPDEVAAGDNPLAAFDGMSEEELGRLDLAVGMGQRWAGHVKQAQERAALDRTVGLGTEAGLQTPPTLDLYRLNVWSTLFGVQPPDALLSDWHRLEREARLDGTASEDSPVFQAPHGDRLQAWVYDKQGFLMTPPTQGTEAEVQAVIAAGGRELARGMSDSSIEGLVAKMEQFLSGPHYAGIGAFGSGTYAADLGQEQDLRGLRLSVAERYAAGHQHGAILHMALKPEAKVVDWGTLITEMQTWAATHAALSRIAPRRTTEDARETLLREAFPRVLAADPGRYAALKGYDAIVNASGSVVILNRAAVVVAPPVLLGKPDKDWPWATAPTKEDRKAQWNLSATAESSADGEAQWSRAIAENLQHRYWVDQPPLKRRGFVEAATAAGSLWALPEHWRRCWDAAAATPSPLDKREHVSEELRQAARRERIRKRRERLDVEPTVRPQQVDGDVVLVLSRDPAQLARRLRRVGARGVAVDLTLPPMVAAETALVDLASRGLSGGVTVGVTGDALRDMSATSEEAQADLDQWVATLLSRLMARMQETDQPFTLAALHTGDTNGVDEAAVKAWLDRGGRAHVRAAKRTDPEAVRARLARTDEP